MGKSYRYTVCALLFFATTINYFDRQVLGILKPLLENRFAWSESEYSYLVIIFQASYALGLLSLGTVIDKIGTKAGYTLCVVIWSLASIAHAFAATFGNFALARGVLGFAESGNFPAAIKAVAEWFPKGERALAVGILTSGTSMGAILAPLLVPRVAAAYGWQSAFFITTFFGCCWLVAWQRVYRAPQKNDVVVEAKEIMVGRPKVRWLDLMKNRRTWIIVIGKFMTDPIWYFMLFWLPSYFADRFALDLAHVGFPLMACLLYTSDAADE